MIEEQDHPDTGQAVYSVTCDGDPGCLDSMYWARNQGLGTLLRTLPLYGWEVIRKHTGTPFPDLNVWCPAHATNPPTPGYHPERPRLGQPYGPGSENFINPN